MSLYKRPKQLFSMLNIAIVVAFSVACAALMHFFTAPPMPVRAAGNVINERDSQSSREGLSSDSLRSGDKVDFQVQFFGVSTLNICTTSSVSDAPLCILIDGFFSRPEFWKLIATRLVPESSRIAYALQRADVKNVAAIYTSHTHYDHVLDTASVAKIFSAKVFGSASTAKVAEAEGVGRDKIVIVKPGQEIAFQDLRVVTFASPHSPSGFAKGEVTDDFSIPASAKDYREGGCFAFGVSLGGSSILIVPSANFPANGFGHFSANTVFLGVGTLGKQPRAFIEEYWTKAVQEVSAKEVILIHWDDFTRPLTEPLRPLPYLFDNLESTLSVLTELAIRDHVRIILPDAFQKFYFGAFRR